MSGGHPQTAPGRWRVVSFSGIDWDYNRQRPQWVMSSLAERGARVLYIDNLGVRLPRMSDARRVMRRLSWWVRTSVRPATEVGSGIRRDSPLVLPVERPALLRWLARRTLVRRIRRRLPPGGPLIVWTNSPIPVIADTTRALGADLLVYDWADDASEHVLFSSAARRRRIAGWEEAMARRADLVFMSSGELLHRRGAPNPRTFLVRHGAPPPATERADPPAEVATLPRPRIGFVGTLSDWVDLELLETLAVARPAWSFLLVGPQRTRVNGLRALPNVTLTGPRRHEAIGGLLSAIDVALIPYRVVPAMLSANPVKLQEYLAHGVPVVSADLPEVRSHVPPVRIASGPAGFLDAIEGALAEGRSATPSPGVSWEQRVDEMVAHVRDALEDNSGR